MYFDLTKDLIWYISQYIRHYINLNGDLGGLSRSSYHIFFHINNPNKNVGSHNLLKLVLANHIEISNIYYSSKTLTANCSDLSEEHRVISLHKLQDIQIRTNVRLYNNHARDI